MPIFHLNSFDAYCYEFPPARDEVPQLRRKKYVFPMLYTYVILADFEGCLIKRMSLYTCFQGAHMKPMCFHMLFKGTFKGQ
jgi:hypothetical protein